MPFAETYRPSAAIAARNGSARGVALAHVEEARPQDIGGTGRQFPSGLTSDRLTAGYLKVLGTFNPRLVSNSTFDLMETDPIIAFGLALRRARLLNLRWNVEGDDAEINAAVTAHLQAHYRKLASCCFRAIPRGVSVPGVEWTVGEFLYDLEEEGEAKQRRLPVAWIVHRVKSLPLDTIRFVIDRPNDLVVGVTQAESFTGDSPIFRIPAVLIWSYRREEVDGDPRGKPLLENVYEPWWWKKIAELKANRYIERLATGVWKTRAGAEVRVAGGGVVDGQTFMGDQIALVKDGDAMTLPSTEHPKMPGTYLFDAELLQDDKRGDMIQNRIDSLDLAILRGLLTADKAATSGDGEGSMAQAEVHAETMEGPLEADVQEFLDEIVNAQFCHPWVDFNFGRERRLASRVRVVPGGMSSSQRDALLEVFKVISQAEQLVGDGQTVHLTDMLDGRGLFEQMGLPLKSAKEIEAIAMERARRAEEMQRSLAGGGGPPDPEEDQRIEEEAVNAGLFGRGSTK